jgi:hypothetical protein
MSSSDLTTAFIGWIDNKLRTIPMFIRVKASSYLVNLLTPELNRSTQRCLTRLFTMDFTS